MQKGERFIITKHGRPVAELRPISSPSRERRQAIIERMKKFQASHSLGEVTIRKLIDEGRKY